jgi:hypothetical protein
MTLPAIFPIATKKKVSILEEVAILVREHWGDEKMRQYLEALKNKEAVTGSVVGDKIFAAAMIKEKAKKSGFQLVAVAKEAEVARCMQTVLRRVQLSHRQRIEALKLAAA